MPISLLGADRILLTLYGEAHDIIGGELEQQLALTRCFLSLLASLHFVYIVKCCEYEEDHGPDKRFFATHCCHFLLMRTTAPEANTASGNITTGSQKIKGACAAFRITWPVPPTLRGLIAMKSSSSANQLTVFRKRLPLPCTGKRLLLANSALPKATSRAAWALLFFSGWSVDSALALADVSALLVFVPAVSVFMVATAAMVIGPRRSLSASNAVRPSCSALRSVSAQLSALVIARP